MIYAVREQGWPSFMKDSPGLPRILDTVGGKKESAWQAKQIGMLPRGSIWQSGQLTVLEDWRRNSASRRDNFSV
jgi:hypothetical protein